MIKTKIKVVAILMSVILFFTSINMTEIISSADSEWIKVSEIEYETAPSAFTLSASAATATSITLQWTKVTDAKKYVIYRSTKKKSGYKKIATINKSKKKYTDKELSEKKTYYYKVKAVGTGRTSNIKTKIKVKGTYKSGAYGGLTSSQLKYIKNCVANVVNVYIDPEMSDKTKAFIISSYIRGNSVYQSNGSTYNYCYTPYGFFKYESVQCTGAAQTMKLLCDAVGIKASVIENGNHRTCKVWYSSGKTNTYNPTPCGGTMGYIDDTGCGDYVYDEDGRVWDWLYLNGYTFAEIVRYERAPITGFWKWVPMSYGFNELDSYYNGITFFYNKKNKPYSTDESTWIKNSDDGYLYLVQDNGEIFYKIDLESNKLYYHSGEWEDITPEYGEYKDSYYYRFSINESGELIILSI